MTKDYKRCFACGVVKTLIEFHIARKRADGVSVYCKECTSKKSSKKYTEEKIQKNCTYCKSIFLGSKNGTFCSQKCKKQSFREKRLKPITGYRKCLQCEIKFPYRETLKVRNYGNIRSVNSKFCSKECSNKATIIRNKTQQITDKMRCASHEVAKKYLANRIQTKEERLQRSINLRGEKSHFWNGGISSENKIFRERIEYRIWRKTIFERDDWTCQLCGIRGIKLHADHIKAFSLYPELRLEVSNGRTLCVECHKKTDTYGWKSNIKLLALIKRSNG